MGLVLDSSVLIVAEREAKPVSSLLAGLLERHAENEIVLSSITVVELEHGLHRAQTAEQAQKRRDYLDTIFAAIPVESFSKEMAQIAAKVDAEAQNPGMAMAPATRFWKISSPDYESDYRHSYINGGLHYPFGSPGVHCDVCGQTWGGSRVLSYECSASLKNPKHFKDRWPSRGVSIWYFSSNSSQRLAQRASRSLTCILATLCNRAISIFRRAPAPISCSRI